MLHSISLGVLAAAFLAASLAAPALALCGDGTIDTGEQCDDGAALSGDGCSDTCQVEWLHGFEVFGVAEGGSVELSLGGETIVAATLTGDFPEDVAAALASEVNASASLQAQGIGAVAESGVVQTSVAAGGTILDGGLSDVASDLDVVRFHRKLSDGQGGVSVLAGDRFGEALAGLGDLDGDGVADLAVGAPLGDLGGLDRGGVRVLFLDTGGRATSEQPFGRNTGGFTGVLGKEMFGGALANLGDLDGDGVVDLAVGAERDDDVATDTGSVWIVFLNTDGTVKAQQKISALEGGFAGPLATKDFFGASVAALGDLDGDGAADVAVGAPNDDDLGTNTGAVWVLLLNADGTVKAESKVVPTGAADTPNQFGTGLSAVGDVDGDGVTDLAVGETDESLWVLLLDAGGTAKDLLEVPQENGVYGFGIGSLGDLSGDGIEEWIVGGESTPARAWLAFPRADGTLRERVELAPGVHGFNAHADPASEFGKAVAALGDLDGDGEPDFAIGAPEEGVGGAVFVLHSGSLVCGDGIRGIAEQCDDALAACSATCELDAPYELDLYGHALSAGSIDLTVLGVPISVPIAADDTADAIAAALTAALQADPVLQASGFGVVVQDSVVRASHPLGVPAISAAGVYDTPSDSTIARSHRSIAIFDAFRAQVANAGDVDGDGVTDLVTSDRDFDYGIGMVEIVFLNADRSVKGRQRVGPGEGGLVGPIDVDDDFGARVRSLGDLDGNGVPDLAVGATGDDGLFSDGGVIWILRLNADGTVLGEQRIGFDEGGFVYPGGGQRGFGEEFAPLGDVDSDGVPDLAVATSRYDGTAALHYTLLLNADGSVKAQVQTGTESGLDWFADVDGDGEPETFTASGADLVQIRNPDGTLAGTLSPGVQLITTSRSPTPDLDADGFGDMLLGQNDSGLSDDLAIVATVDSLAQPGTLLPFGLRTGGFGGEPGKDFGTSVAWLGDLDGDGRDTVAVADEDGRAWLVDLNDPAGGSCGDGTLQPSEQCDDGNALDGDGCSLTCEVEFLHALELFGAAEGGGSVSVTLAGLTLEVFPAAGDVAARVARDLADLINADLTLQSLGVGAIADSGILYTSAALQSHLVAAPGLDDSPGLGPVRSSRSIGEGMGFFGGIPAPGFGIDIGAPLGDLDGDGVDDLAVISRLELWVLHLAADGTVASEQLVAPGVGGFVGPPGGFSGTSDGFRSVAGLGDIDADGVGDLIACRPFDGAGGTCWVLRLNADGTVKAEQEISPGVGGFTGPLAVDDYFGNHSSGLGDLDGDGTPDAAVAASNDDDGVTHHGAVWILRLNPDGTVKGEQKISATQGGFAWSGADEDFAVALAGPGDIDGDGTADLVVGADGGQTAEPGFYVLFLDTDGSVLGQRRTDHLHPVFQGLDLDRQYGLGTSLASRGDVDGDGIPDLWAGVGSLRMLWLLHFDQDGDVRAGGFFDEDDAFLDLDPSDNVGRRLAVVGDSPYGGLRLAANRAPNLHAEDRVIVLDLTDALVCGDGAIGFTEQCDDGGTTDGDGCSATCGVEDANLFTLTGVALGGGVVELEIAGETVSVSPAPGDTAEEVAEALVAAIFAHPGLRAQGVGALASGGSLLTSAALQSVLVSDPGLSDPAALVHGQLDSSTFWQAVGSPTTSGAAVALGDLGGDGTLEVAIGEPAADGGRGAVRIVSFGVSGVPTGSVALDLTTLGLGSDVAFGSALAAPGDLDGDTVADLLVGAPLTDAGGNQRGAVYTVYLNVDGTLKSFDVFGADDPLLTGAMDNLDHFGSALAVPGDLDGNGYDEWAVGTPDDDDGANGAGAVWILFRDALGVSAVAKVSDTAGGFGGGLAYHASFGRGLAAPGDLDGDLVADLLAIDDDDVWLLRLAPDGSVASETLVRDDVTPRSIAAIDDLDDDGLPDFATSRYPGPGPTQWIVEVVSLSGVGTAKAVRAFGGGGLGGFGASDPDIGASLALLGDLDGDLHPTLLVDEWVVELRSDAVPECGDGFDNDGDGDVDFPADPGCASAASALEGTQCDDDFDNDGDGLVDWDGGDGGIPDGVCNSPTKNREKARSCGVGVELVVLLVPLMGLRRRLRRRG